MEAKKILVGAVCGLLSAIVVDFRAWNAEQGEPFKVAVMIKHAVIGIITGGLTAAGVSLV